MTQLSLFDLPREAEIPLAEFFEAYFDCRRNKRRTINALAFEKDYESELLWLHREVNDGSYRPGRSIAFIVEQPVQREIFAADFRDRVVHHLVINKLNPLFEKEFIHDSYACRKGKGTLFGIRRVDRFIRRCSENYTRDCNILKLDIEGFFMRIDRSRLFGRLERFVLEKYHGTDTQLLIGLLRRIIFYEPTSGCHIKGGRDKWDGLPDSKSLFHSPPGCGLPIGNLTSQIFANFYMTPFDHYMKHRLGIRYYGRYVDDFIVVHPDRECLKSLIPAIRDYLFSRLGLKLHPPKDIPATLQPGREIPGRGHKAPPSVYRQPDGGQLPKGRRRAKRRIAPGSPVPVGAGTGGLPQQHEFVSGNYETLQQL